MLRTTWSPGATVETPAPTASTTPAPSWPSTAGSGSGSPPARAVTSVWHTPAAATRTSTSPGPGSGRSSSSTAILPTSRTTAAFIALSLSYGDGLGDRHGHPVPTEHMEAPGPPESRFVNLEAWPTFPNRLHGKLAIETSQVETDAEVRTATEGHRGGLEDPVDVIGVGIGIDTLIPVRRTHDQQHIGLGRDRHTVE